VEQIHVALAGHRARNLASHLAGHERTGNGLLWGSTRASKSTHTSRQAQATQTARHAQITSAATTGQTEA
jgi:hypothetical protein